MPFQNRIVHPGPKQKTVLDPSGSVLIPPEEWVFLKAGNGPLTRSVKSRCFTWQVQVKKGKRTISKGIWADKDHVEAAQKELERKRATPQYQRQRAAELKRKERKHAEYVDDFYQATLDFLAFHPAHRQTAEHLAQSVTDLATPVGSGTVGRTTRIPVHKRVEAAVIAWLRHQTTGYDQMHIIRKKGSRREVRRMLAQKSMAMLAQYRTGETIDSTCPLQQALMMEHNRTPLAEEDRNTPNPSDSHISLNRHDK